jgi:hypothetical protein
LDAGLALAVAAEAEAVGTEVVVGDLPGGEGGGFLAKGFDFGADGLVVLVVERVDYIDDNGSIGVGQNWNIRILYRE